MVRRTDNNFRSRPNAARRHDPIQSEDFRESHAYFFSESDLEWTSLNYRK